MKRPPARARTRPEQTPVARVVPIRREQPSRKIAPRKINSRDKAAKQAFREQIRMFTASSRRRRIFVSVTAGSLLALFGLLLATWFTPIFAIEKIEISGLQRLKPATVMNAVANLKGASLTLLDENQIQNRLKGFSLIESFSVVANPPHTLELHIVERQPIAIVKIGGTRYLYDPAGVQIGVAASDDRYPTVSVKGEPSKSDTYHAAIDVMLALPVELSGQVATIEANSRDNVKLTLAGNVSRSVVWGDSSQSVLKSKVLAALIKTTKVNRSVVFDVSSPNAPTVRFLNF